MADLTAADVAVAIGKDDVDFLHANKVIFPTLTFGDAAKTYPAGGIPLPALHYFDLKKGIKRAKDVLLGGLFYHVDISNHKLMIYYGDYSNASDGPLVEYVGAPAATTLPLEIIGQ